MATNSPWFTVRLTSESTSLRCPGSPYPLLTPSRASSGTAAPMASVGSTVVAAVARFAVRSAVRSALMSAGFRNSQPVLDQLHHAVEQDAHHPDGQDAQDDVFVDQAVVLLP